MLHPQARALLDLMEAKKIPPLHTLSPVEARTLYRERRYMTQPSPPEIGLVLDCQCDGPHGAIPLRVYRPLGVSPDALLPVLVYFHGGGFVIGDLETHDTLCRELANRSQCGVVAVDYRLAPENPYPCALDDCLAATYWVSRHAQELKLRSDSLAVGGDSAGGNLAAVVSLLARDAGDLPIAFQLLIYPATDARCVASSYAENGQGYLLTSDTMDYFLQHYAPDAGQRLEPTLSPLLHPDLARLPPSLVLTAGFDPLRDEGAQYAQRLSESGNRATLVCFTRQIHGFILMGRVLDEANNAVALCADELARALNP
ncbi:MAG: alpha/beta hydrolase [Rhodoferax sp.]|nr:MAG: alpha/beta hydrolase [Rhodoferax sp.]